MVGQAKHWCFTSFDADEPRYNSTDFIYMCYQRESCPDTGNQHWQGYLVFKIARRLEYLKRNCSRYGIDGAHFEIAKGTACQNKEYCSKTSTACAGTFTEHGEIPTQGTRSDLEACCARVKEGVHPNTVIYDQPSAVRVYKCLDRFHNICESKHPVLRDVKGFFIHGEAGSGKSLHVWSRVMYRGFYCPSVEGSRIWFDHYAGEDCIWLDDFYYVPEMCGQLLKILDRYPYRAPVKGETVMLKHTEVYITSNFPPPDDEAILRRLTVTKM